MKRAIVVAAVVTGLAGCQGMAAKIARLDVGTSRSEVIERLGRPDSDRSIIGYEVLSWLDRRPGRFSFSHKDYTVVLKDDRVVQFGPGLIRRDGKTSLQIETDDP
ncbi:outer membrane protein assembly factor BamE [Luteibacter yeojuensis]|uniref:Outer membrane protein assembly factor BamE n=1 Tax=Luteibacter yeojuensis TaxID=345309 RepID=A0A7X5QSY9_9GAMM|nr:outer membrane protein assembly factor BamE [Luteibacter yeojuensis]NID14863.1 outer membrane protein assembly factor BamE [Luteibacter yeojuensis]